MRIVLSGYYGYDNAGDEAVLAAILDHISAQTSAPEFVVTSGAPHTTESLHAGSQYSLRAIARDNFKTFWREVRNCDAFISGGGSLIQDVTSLRNVVYYTGLIRLANLARKPSMIYAQGVGPLRKPLSQKLTRVALNSRNVRAITVRDPDSKALLRKIGVHQPIEITADPVWGLEAQSENSRTSHLAPRTWCVSIRSWLNASTPNAEAALLAAIRAAAQQAGASLRFLPMQPARDRALIESLGVSGEEILETANLHPREIMRLAGECEVMIAMRLHALIFAAAQGVPCVAVSYDPKVTALAHLISTPVVSNASESELAKLENAASAPPPHALFVAELQSQARRNAEVAAQLQRK